MTKSVLDSVCVGILFGGRTALDPCNGHVAMMLGQADTRSWVADELARRASNVVGNATTPLIACESSTVRCVMEASMP
jgi:hypothetical protein